MSAILLLIGGVVARNIWSDYKDKNNIKKEINRRFRFNNRRDDEAGNSSNDFRENFVPPQQEESKGDGYQPPKDNSVLTRGVAAAGAMFGALAIKSGLKKTAPEEDEDPTKYHPLEDGGEK